MSDFLVWLSPMPIPQILRRRWNWPHSETVATRRHRFRDLGHWHDEDCELVLVGHGRGRRGKRRFCAANALAPSLAKEIDAHGAAGLDRFLGPISGVHITDDGRRATVWRDRFGRHPLQMIRLSHGWAITTCPGITARLSRGVPRWSNTSNFIHGAHSTSDADVFDDVFRVRPGEVVYFDQRSICGRRQWWTPSPQTSPQPREKMSAMLHGLGRLYGPKPHLLALSAGLDSATLGAFISRHHPRNEAFTFADPHCARDESAQAAHIADHLRIRWAPFQISHHWPLSRVADHRFPTAWGPPSHPDSAWKMPCYRWLHRRRPHLPVMYGNGADEVLWFPPRLWLESRWYRRDWPALVQASRHLPFSRWIRAGAGTAVDSCGLRTIRELLPRGVEEPLWQDPGQWIGNPPSLSSSLPRTKSPFHRFVDLRLRRLQGWRWERIMRFLAFESRRANRPVWTPFLDAEFWELSLSLRPEHLVEGGRQKAILRRITARLLPDECRQRPKFGGFDAIVERGLALEASPQVFALFARPVLDEWAQFRSQRFLQAYEAYRRSGHAPTSHARGSWAIWRTVATELWLRRHYHRPVAPH